MAYADYRLCDVCDSKAFYDSNLDYVFVGESQWGDEPVKQEDCVRDTNYRLQYLGDWAVLCKDCAKTYKCVIVPIESASTDTKEQT